MSSVDGDRGLLTPDFSIGPQGTSPRGPCTSFPLPNYMHVGGKETQKERLGAWKRTLLCEEENEGRKELRRKFPSSLLLTPQSKLCFESSI